MFIHYAFNCQHAIRVKREIRVVKHILTICGILSLTGTPTLFFLIQFFITGQFYPLANRVHEFCLAISISTVTVGFTILNSMIKLVPTKVTASQNLIT